MLDLDRLLRFAVEQSASDVHVKVGARPRLRVDGRLREGPFDTVEPSDTERLVTAILPPQLAEEFRARSEADFTYSITGLGRFRVSAFRQRGWIGLVLRRVLPGVPGFEALTLPPVVQALSEQTNGLVLVSGLGGSGRTATMAAMVDAVNAARECHIVTIEDPIEVIHADKRAVVDQREVGTDTPSAHVALEHALRQDPDVIMVSQLRDVESVAASMHAAEAGHLVIAGFSTVNATDTIDRLVEMFEPHRQRQMRSSLALVLRGILVQRLVPRAGGRGRVPAVEVLVVNARVRERIADPSRVEELTAEMEHGDLYGMQTFDQSLSQLYRDGLVTRTDALEHADSPGELRFTLDRADFERGQASGATTAATTAASANGVAQPA
ncbi:MAG: PilT/PilU family type 4a pilus ATPase [Acidimicrobiia bacterium]